MPKLLLINVGGIDIYIQPPNYEFILILAILQERTVKIYGLHRNMICGIIDWVPVSVEKPHRISLHSISILIPVPAIVSMRSVLYVKNGMSKAGLPIC